MVRIENQPEIKQAITNLQKDSFILLNYSDENTLVLNHLGTGGVAELKERLNEDQVQFCLIRLSAPKDDPTNPNQDMSVKDVLITLLGSKVSKIKKAKKKADQGEVYGILQPNHAQIDCYNSENLTQANILAKADPSSGSHIIE